MGTLHSPNSFFPNSSFLNPEWNKGYTPHGRSRSNTPRLSELGYHQMMPRSRHACGCGFRVSLEPLFFRGGSGWSQARAPDARPAPWLLGLVRGPMSHGQGGAEGRKAEQAWSLGEGSRAAPRPVWASARTQWAVVTWSWPCCPVAPACCPRGHSPMAISRNKWTRALSPGDLYQHPRVPGSRRPL